MPDELDGLTPYDLIKLRVELANRRRVAPEEAAANRRRTAEEVLGFVPGPGNALAARDAYQGAQAARDAFRRGEIRRGLVESGLAGLSGLGAVVGLPFGRAAAAAARNGPLTAYTFPAWHGSPHDFDRFDISKIGTGEGNQAYGHGLYFASSKDVAKYYRDTLAAYIPSSNARIYKVEIDTDPERLLNWDARFERQTPEVQRALRDLPDTKAWRDAKAEWEAIRAERDRYLNQNITRDMLPYGMELNKRERRAALRAEELENLFHEYRRWTGTRPQINALNELGIPGIRYLDRNSRDVGAGSSNYVIFDDKLVKILGKE
jgi:hypothetical protein